MQDLRNKISVMGILNVTPDSFSDGGHHAAYDQALFHTEQMIQEGAAVIDIGGESTRPGAADVPIEQELERVIPVLQAIRNRFDIPVSVDTSKAEVMREAISYGAGMINDVRALQEDGALAACADSDVQVCLMHMQGQPRTMQANPTYNDVINDIGAFFEERLLACQRVGIDKERIWLDPGFGFGKTSGHNVELLRRLDELNGHGLPLLIGISRKSVIGTLLGDKPVDQRLHGSVAAAVIATLQGAKMLRVHDVGATVDALKITEAVLSQ